MTYEAGAEVVAICNAPKTGLAIESPTPDEELEIWRGHIDELEQELSSARDRLRRLEREMGNSS